MNTNQKPNEPSDSIANRITAAAILISWMPIACCFGVILFGAAALKIVLCKLGLARGQYRDGVWYFED